MESEQNENDIDKHEVNIEPEPKEKRIMQRLSKRKQNLTNKNYTQKM